MKITKLFTVEETADLLRQVPLKGNPDTFPYEYSEISLMEAPINKLMPCKYYLYKSKINTLSKIPEKDYICSLFRNRKAGCVEYTLDNDEESYYWLPPIIEHTYDQNGNYIFVIADGLHRIYMDMCGAYHDTSCFIVRTDGHLIPYHSYPIRGGWAGLGVYDGILYESFRGWDYRDNYKELLRDFNAVFRGIQPVEIFIKQN